MKPGDLVQIKDFYRDEFDEVKYRIITEIFEDDDGFLWYKIVPCNNTACDESHWHPDYQIEMLSEI